MLSATISEAAAMSSARITPSQYRPAAQAGSAPIRPLHRARGLFVLILAAAALGGCAVGFAPDGTPVIGAAVKGGAIDPDTFRTIGGTIGGLVWGKPGEIVGGNLGAILATGLGLLGLGGVGTAGIAVKQGAKREATQAQQTKVVADRDFDDGYSKGREHGKAEGFALALGAAGVRGGAAGGGVGGNAEG